jgi:hypothetical protein
MFMDGETEVSLGNASDVNSGTQTAFDGILETPNLSVVVSTVEWETILSAAIPTTKTRVRIWTNHPTEPDKVVVGLG